MEIRSAGLGGTAANQYQESSSVFWGPGCRMNPFEFTSVSKIIFGRGKIAELGFLARALGSEVLMIHNGDDPGRGGPVDRRRARARRRQRRLRRSAAG